MKSTELISMTRNYGFKITFPSSVANIKHFISNPFLEKVKEVIIVLKQTLPVKTGSVLIFFRLKGK